MDRIRSASLVAWSLWDLAKQRKREAALSPLEDVGGRLDGLNVLITGPTSGIGRETAKELVRRGARVTLACRNVKAGEELRAEIEEERRVAEGVSFEPEVAELELGSFASVRALAASWASSGRPLHVLLNNGGMNRMGCKAREESSDGLEIHLAVNYAGPALLTLLLTPSLLEAEAQTRRPSRVVHVSSIGHFLGRLHRADLGLGDRYDDQRAYAQSKLMQVLFSWELQRRLRGKVLSIAVHPGAVNSNLTRDLPEGRARDVVLHAFDKYGFTPLQGCRASLVAATDPALDPLALEMVEPVYLTYTGERQRAARKARDQDRALWVWTWTERVALGRRNAAADLVKPVSLAPPLKGVVAVPSPPRAAALPAVVSPETGGVCAPTPGAEKEAGPRAHPRGVGEGADRSVPSSASSEEVVAPAALYAPTEAPRSVDLAACTIAVA